MINLILVIALHIPINRYRRKLDGLNVTEIKVRCRRLLDNRIYLCSFFCDESTCRKFVLSRRILRVDWAGAHTKSSSKIKSRMNLRTERRQGETNFKAETFIFVKSSRLFEICPCMYVDGCLEVKKHRDERILQLRKLVCSLIREIANREKHEPSSSYVVGKICSRDQIDK